MKSVVVTIAMLCVAITAHASAVSDTVNFTLTSGGINRVYTMHLPDSMSADRPVVIYLHGYGSRIAHRADLDKAADRHGFAVCYPEGSRDKIGKQCWNVGYPCQDGMEVDDVAFVRDLLSDICSKFNLNSRNAFCTGMSNGGEMCYLMAYTAPGLFAAYASVSGLTMEWIYNNCDATEAVPFMEIHGTEDRTSEWFGDLLNNGGWGSYIPVPIAIGYWIARNRCYTETVESVESLRSPKGYDAVVHRYTGSDASPEVLLYEMVGGPHSWYAADLNTGELVWNFFSRYVTH